MSKIDTVDFLTGSEPLRVGIDVGSTTVKIVILDENDTILFSKYERHRADIRTTIIAVVNEALDVAEKAYPEGKESF